MKRSILLSAIISMFFFVGCSEDNSRREMINEAVKATEAWLDFIDNNDYHQSWEETGSIFQKQMSDSQWVIMLDNNRKPFGQTISRKKISAVYKKSLPGVADGQYVVTTFQTEFENKKNAIETVTATFEEKQWKVVGYFIK